MTVNPMRGAAMNAIEPMMRSIALVEALPVPLVKCEFGVEARGQYLGAPCLKGPERSQTASGGMKHWHRIDPRIVGACPDRQSVDPTVVSQVPMR